MVVQDLEATVDYTPLECYFCGETFGMFSARSLARRKIIYSDTGGTGEELLCPECDPVREEDD